MGELIEAEFRVVQERTLPVIASEILQIEENVARTALDGAVRIGVRLQEAKEKVPHGEWEQWCQDNLNYSKSKAEKLMKISKEYGDKNSIYAKTYTCTDLSVSKALRLLQVPEDEVEKFTKEHPVEDMTVKELEKEIKELKAAKADSKAKIEGLSAENTRIKGKAAMAEREIEEARKSIERKSEQIEAERKKLEDEKADLERLTAERGESDEEKEKIKTLESEIEKRKEREKILEKQLRESEERIRDEVERTKAEAENKFKSELKKAEEHAEKGPDEELLKFKLKVDQLQDVFNECASLAADEKQMNALKTILMQLGESI